MSLSACSLRTLSAQQREDLALQRPASILGEAERPEGTWSLRVRVYVDEDHAREVPEHEARFRAQVERANRTLRAAIGAELQITDFRPGWRWTEGPDHLASALLALAREDPAEDVELVIGLVGALDLASPVFSNLGRAYRPGRHLVLRGMDDPEDLARLERAYGALPREEVLEVYRARRLHRETAVLLHELAHALGAPHVEEDETLMSPTLSPRAGRFALATVAVMRAGLSSRPPPGAPAPLETNEDHRARQFLDRGRPEDAIELLAPLAAAGAATAEGYALLCEAHGSAPRASAELEPICLRAAERAPDSPVPGLVLARLHLERGEPERAIEHADRALERLSAGPLPRPEALALASVYRALFDLEGARLALGGAADSEARYAIARWIQETQDRLDPLGWPEAPGAADHRAFLRDLLRAEERFAHGAYLESVEILRRAPRAYRRSAALITLECAALQRAKRLWEARRRCEEGLQLYPRSPELLTARARVEASKGRVGDAIRWLERAVAVAPEGHEAHSLLARLRAALGPAPRAAQRRP